MQQDILSLSQTGHGSAISYNPSVISSLLPSIVKRRLPPIHSIRELASTYIRPGLHRRASSESSNSSVSPPPPYSADPPSDDEDMDADYTSAPSSRPSSSGTSTPTARPSFDLMRPDSVQSAENLIRYKFANHGLLLLAQSAHESKASIHANDEYQRRLYLDGLAYLLKGLPDSLSEDETARLRGALPDALKDATGSEHVSGETGYRNIREGAADLPLLRVLVQTIVFWLFFIFATALPHIKLLMRHVYAFERRHKLGAQLLSQCLVLAQLGYSQLLAFLCAVWAMNDGMIGRMLTQMGIWFAQNVSDGVRDGLSEATAALRESYERR